MHCIIFLLGQSIALYHILTRTSLLYYIISLLVICPTGSPSRGGDVAVYVFDKNQPSLPTSACSVLVSVSVFITLSTVFYSIKSPDNSPLSNFVLPILFLPYWFFQLYTSLQKSPSARIQPLWLTGFKAQTK